MLQSMRSQSDTTWQLNNNHNSFIVGKIYQISFFSSVRLSGVFLAYLDTTKNEDPRVYEILFFSDCYDLNCAFPGNLYVRTLAPSMIDLWEVIRFKWDHGGGVFMIGFVPL